jgi:taurine dioxygenase
MAVATLRASAGLTASRSSAQYRSTPGRRGGPGSPSGAAPFATVVGLNFVGDAGRDAARRAARRHPGGTDMTALATLATRRLSDVAGAEITGVDLARPLTPALRDAIMAAFLEHQLLVFRDQRLSQDQQHALTLHFGEIEGHVSRQADGSRTPIVHMVSNLDEQGNPTATPHERGNYFWHTDKSYHAEPSLLTILHAIELPPDGGDTQFASAAAGYAALPEETKREIAGLRVVHSWEASRRNAGGRLATEEEIRERPPVVHPLVRTHPDTGVRTLYLGLHTSHVVGMAEAEGRALLDRLLAHTTQPSFVHVHHWRAGDLVMWDNRCLLHRALRNYEMSTQRRVLQRTVVKGTAPF